MKSAEYVDSRLHYGIKAGSSLSIEHLLSIMLRCDWTDLCTHFTSTFRQSYPFEAMISVKERNREYAIWSRLIRETVEYYGHRGFGDYDKDQQKFINKVPGPFYCGMKWKMNIPQFNIRLCGPTSTTRYIEVAQRFGGADGIMLKLDNSGTCNSDRLRIFPCDWISNYSGEDEYLFAGGQYQIRIVSIRDMVTSDNYQEFCRALFHFDCMIRGITVDFTNSVMMDDASEKEVDTLKQLIRSHRRMDSKRPYPAYIHNWC